MSAPCTYTGATVEFEEYGFLAPADLYLVGDTVVIRWNPNGKTYQYGESEVTHGARLTNSFHREDLGVTVVPLGDFRGNPVRP